ncbi:MAG: hypothetical protein QOJ59_49 [Thermomicrobiales bacterium]|jgi:hypothetical protein|nr:hypothetical protein [Thermomicrobiales bacterium]
MRGKGISSRQHETTMVDGMCAAALDGDKNHSTLLPSVPSGNDPTHTLDNRSRAPGMATPRHGESRTAGTPKRPHAAARRKDWAEERKNDPKNARTINRREPSWLPGNDHARRRGPRGSGSAKRSPSLTVLRHGAVKNDGRLVHARLLQRRPNGLTAFGARRRPVTQTMPPAARHHRERPHSRDHPNGSQ